MTATTLRVRYAGPALADGTMDIQDLAPSLLALGSLCEEANRILNGKRTQVAVRIKADFAAGSFEVGLEVIQTLYDQMKTMLLGEDITAGVQLITLLGIGAAGGGGLINFLKWLAGRRPQRVRQLEGDAVAVEVGTETRVVPRAVLDLYRDVPVRAAMAKLVRPIARDGIDAIEFRAADAPAPTEVSKADLLALAEPSPDDELLQREERRQVFKIISLAFKEDNKWRLHDGHATLSATIADRDFLDRIEQNDVAFAKGDILTCMVLIEQWQRGEELKTEYTITKVLEHRSAARQLPLPFEPPPAQLG